MDRIVAQWRDLAPALGFLLAGVPLAALLDRLGVFDALAERIVARSPRGVHVGALWALAAATTVVLNLDTTIVLLTPLYLRLARRVGGDEVAVALVPLLMASLASSVLPVSNLTTLIRAEHSALTTADVLVHLALPSLAAVVVGWIAYRRRHGSRLPPTPTPTPTPTPSVAADGRVLDDRRSLVWGAAVVTFVLVGFVAGPTVGVDAWVVALVADVVLVAATRWLPWRTVPLGTAIGVGAVAAVVAVAVPVSAAAWLARHDAPAELALVAVGGALAAGLVNNLPALLATLGPRGPMGWSAWAWLLGVNAGAVLAPTGALANLLWLRIVAAEGVAIPWRRYVRLVVPIAAPAFAAAVFVVVGERILGVVS